MVRHYKPSDLGPLCAAGCGTRIVRQLVDAGIAEHPACVRADITRQNAAASWDREAVR